MKMTKPQLRRFLIVLALSSPVIFLFENCAEHNFSNNEPNLSAPPDDKVNSDPVREVQSLNESPHLDKVAEGEKQTVESEEESRRKEMANYLVAKEHLLMPDGHLTSLPWTDRISEMIDFQQNMAPENEAEAIALGKESLTELISDIGDAAPSELHDDALARSMALLSYGIKNPQDRSVMQTYFLSQTRNPDLIKKLTESFSVR